LAAPLGKVPALGSSQDGTQKTSLRKTVGTNRTELKNDKKERRKKKKRKQEAAMEYAYFSVLSVE
jgi:hypothetical protein